MEFLAAVAGFLSDPANWQGSDGIPIRMAEHLWYSLVASVAALALALPIGLLVGHTGRGGELAVNLSGLGRAIPSFGFVILAFLLLPFGYTPVFLALVALAFPPIVANTYVGLRAIDPEVRDAAVGMGLTGWQVLTRVELPVASPLLMAGIRTAVVQIVATATLAAFLPLGGLGRYIFDGLRQQDHAQVFAGALLVALLALATELALARLQRAVVPVGIAARQRVEATRPAT